MPKVLVTGGAGYIGSHTVLALNRSGYEVTVVDNLSAGREDMVTPPAKFIKADLKDADQITGIFQEGEFDSVVHFAASIIVSESVANPMLYYKNNTTNTTSLIDIAIRNNIKHFIFSSSAAVYGYPKHIPIPETEVKKPINPYGRTKLITEWVLDDMANVNPEFTYAGLRYFNVAGADPKLRIGQCGNTFTHLIKIASQAASKVRDKMAIYGDKYPTPDGTCVRDYLHVTDLADAHVCALKYLESGGKSDFFNCGYGHGFSVREIVDKVKQVSGQDFRVDIEDPRPGDPAELVADPAKLMATFDWKPKYDDIEFIIKTALDWEEKLKTL